MKFWVLLLLAPAITHANDTFLPFQHSKDGKIFVETKDCETAKSIAEGLRNWSLKLHESVPELATPVTTKAGCRYDLTKVLPTFVKKMDAERLKESWGNCFGAAFAGAGMVPNYFLTADMGEDILDWLEKSGLCTLVAGNPQPGDVGAVRQSWAWPPLVHGFVYIAEGYVFSKNSWSKDDAPALQTTKNMQLLNPGKIEYYHCDRYSELLSGLSPNEKEEFLKADQSLQNIEVKCNERAFNPPAGSCEDPKLTKFREPMKLLLNALYEKGGVNSKNSRYSAAARKLWRILYLRAEGVGNFN